MRSIISLLVLIFALNAAPFTATANAGKFHPCKMFAEDIENVLKLNYKANVDLSNDKMQGQNNNLINDYMVKHLNFNIDSKPVSFRFVGFEKEKESVYCYLEVLNVPSIKKLSVTDSILYDFKNEQINIIHVMVNGKRQSTKVDYPQNQASFSF